MANGFRHWPTASANGQRLPRYEQPVVAPQLGQTEQLPLGIG